MEQKDFEEHYKQIFMRTEHEQGDKCIGLCEDRRHHRESYLNYKYTVESDIGVIKQGDTEIPLPDVTEFIAKVRHENNRKFWYNDRNNACYRCETILHNLLLGGSSTEDISMMYNKKFDNNITKYTIFELHNLFRHDKCGVKCVDIHKPNGTQFSNTIRGTGRVHVEIMKYLKRDDFSRHKSVNFKHTVENSLNIRTSWYHIDEHILYDIEAIITKLEEFTNLMHNKGMITKESFDNRKSIIKGLEYLVNPFDKSHIAEYALTINLLSLAYIYSIVAWFSNEIPTDFESFIVFIRIYTTLTPVFGIIYLILRFRNKNRLHKDGWRSDKSYRDNGFTGISLGFIENSENAILGLPCTFYTNKLDAKKVPHGCSDTVVLIIMTFTMSLIVIGILFLFDLVVN